MAIERIVSAMAVDEVEVEQELDQTLRPKDFDNYIGQKRLKQNLKLKSMIKKLPENMFFFDQIHILETLNQLPKICGFILKIKWIINK